MKQALLPILFLCCFKFCVLAQQKEIADTLKSRSKNNIHLELGGSCIWGSVNYERLVYHGDISNWYAKAGILPLNIIGKTNPLVGSFSLIMTRGETQHQLIAGLGLVMAVTFIRLEPWASYPSYGGAVCTSIGYQYNGSNQYFGRVLLNPLFSPAYTPYYVLPWLGISTGKYF